MMPPWFISCHHCQGEIRDALLECLPLERQTSVEYTKLFNRMPGAAIACPYCNKLIGFGPQGAPQNPETGWPVFRYSRAALELKRAADGLSGTTSLCEWYTQCYLFPEDVPPAGFPPFTC